MYEEFFQASDVTARYEPGPYSASREKALKKAHADGYRREHVQAFAQRVEVADDAVYLKGNKNVLLRRLIVKKEGTTAGIGVPGFVPKWRREWDSNPR